MGSVFAIAEIGRRRVMPQNSGHDVLHARRLVLGAEPVSKSLDENDCPHDRSRQDHSRYDLGSPSHRHRLAMEAQELKRTTSKVVSSLNWPKAGCGRRGMKAGGATACCSPTGPATVPGGCSYQPGSSS